MALINCPECGRQVSTAAKTCPACGYPVAEQGVVTSPVPVVSSNPLEGIDLQIVLLEVRPSWWNFTLHLLFFWLIVPLIIAIYRRHTFVMRIYPDRVAVEEGFWSKDSREFFIKDVRAIDVRQGVWGRLVGIGDLTVSTAATVDAAEVAHGVPRPHQIKELLISQRQRFTT